MIEKTLCGEPAPARNKKWVTAWTASVQGPYPSGFALLQPDLSLVFPDPARGAADQSFRMIVRPDLWGGQARIRLSNAFGTKPVRFDQVYIGLQFESSAVSAGTNRPVTFGGKEWVEIPPGKDAWSDAAALPFVPEDDAASFLGRKLAVSFHVMGESGPMTWHAKALTTSYLTMPHAGAASAREDEAAFPFSTTSVFFLDAVDMMADAGTKLVVAFGDSITDGMGASLNGQDRWPDVLSRRLHDRFGSEVAVVNAGIAGNRILKPDLYSAERAGRERPGCLAAPPPRRSQPLRRLGRHLARRHQRSRAPWRGERWRELEQAITFGVRALRSAAPAIRMIGATLTSARGSAGLRGKRRRPQSAQRLHQDQRSFRRGRRFRWRDGQSATGALKAEYAVPTNGVSKEDGLHPNRAGYLAMGASIDLDALVRDIAAEPSS